MGNEIHTTAIRSARDFEQVVRHLQLLAAEGISPQLVAVERPRILTVRLMTLDEWLVTASSTDIDDMGRRLVQTVESMHAVGVCHRDLHVGNLLVDQNRPLIIDLELAKDVDPAGPCYDLQGPSSEVPIPQDHLSLGGDIAKYGVWWDAPLQPPYPRPLHTVFGASDALRS